MSAPSGGHSWPEVLSGLVQGRDLSADQTAWAMGEILSGEATVAQIAGFAIALRAKGETVEEVSGLVDTMYALATPISVPGRLLDVVGTGGDRSMSVNISTMSAIVAAGAGARVVKHGNRSASSQSGSADVLESLGIRLPAAVREAYMLFGRREDLHSNMQHLLDPGDFYVDDRKEALVFREENQGVASWGILLADLQHPDPPVRMQLDLADKDAER